MYPVLTFALAGQAFAVTSYRFFFVLAAATTLGLSLAVAARRGLPGRRVAPCLLAAAVAVPVGARALDVLTKPAAYAGHLERILAVDLDGFSLYGGLLLALAVGGLACGLARLDLRRLADATAPGLGVGIALMRLGCFAAGCCFGRETNLPWGVTFPPGSEAHSYQLLHGGRLFALAAPAPVHPTELYEALAALGAAALALWLAGRRHRSGVPFLAALLWYDAFRLANHFLRVPASGLDVPAWFYPVVYLGVLALAGAVLAWRTSASPAAGEALAPRPSYGVVAR